LYRSRINIGYDIKTVKLKADANDTATNGLLYVTGIISFIIKTSEENLYIL